MENITRDHHWLDVRLSEIWEAYFADVPREPNLTIKFGVKAKNRLGSIRRRHNRTIITVTGFFRDPAIPDYVLTETIAHELAHYAHGFESPLPKLYRYPHEGGIVRKELAARGLATIHRQSRRWLKLHWGKIAVKVRTHRLIIRRKPGSLGRILRLTLGRKRT